MPARWLYVTVAAASDWEAELLADALVGAGASGVEQRDRQLATYLAPPADPEHFLAGLRSTLASAIGREPELSVEWRPDADWAREWRRGLGARRVGRGLIVTPTWIAPDAGPGDTVISIDPQMAFGTGEHATTRGALRLLEERVRAGDRVLDMGTGSGILAIAAARLGARSVLAVEADADALINARENVERNAVAERVELRHALVDARFLLARQEHFDLILANVLSGVLRPLLPELRSALRPGGWLILGGILQSESAALLGGVGAAGLEVVAEDREEEWWSVLLRR
jgi:ribosomal protein L11 methyltransferase